jgi:hypothetical protein
MDGPRHDLIDRNNLLAQGEALREQYKLRWVTEKGRADKAEAENASLCERGDRLAELLASLSQRTPMHRNDVQTIEQALAEWRR